MSLPSAEQYQQAFQLPLSKLFNDPQLQSGNVEMNGMGLPRTRAGNFALTYEVHTPSRKFAVRCFHKNSNNLALRYAAISKKLSTLNSCYFVYFDYLTNGVLIEGKAYPLVKMGWAEGETLAEFLVKNFNVPQKISKLRDSLSKMGHYLESQQISHGDLQPGNVMVSQSGVSIQLIDYDGMYVPEIKAMEASEIGHRNFQHPKRSSKNFNERIDYFSLITLELSLRALEIDPSIWDATKSDEEGVVFRANDFADPENSTAFRLVSKLQGLNLLTKNFAAICKSDISSVPTVSDFILGKNIPLVNVNISEIKIGSTQSKQKYISSYPVINTTNYVMCVANVGNRVELIGMISEVQKGTTQYGKNGKKNRPYIFVNFGNKKTGQLVRIKIWSEGLEKLQPIKDSVPASDWVNTWITVTAVIEPEYISKKYGYRDVSVIVDNVGQMRQITEAEAQYRLDITSNNSKIAQTLSPKAVSENQNAVSNNQKIIQNMTVGKAIPQSSNRKLGSQTPTPSYTPSASRPTQHNQKAPSKGSSYGWIWYWIIGLVVFLLIKK